MEVPIGEGQFGLCFGGEHQGKRVAVKTAKNSVDGSTLREFLAEIRLMALLDRHENIVEFIGVVTHDDVQSE